ncbi:MAG: glutamate--cysteine ligase [Planctomycetota bacterium]|nr:MAG: glutamate--cysteine ligase [Planctomycetota bacterium]
MMAIEFPSNPYPSVGVEIELQTIDPHSKALIQGAPRILRLGLEPEHIKKELLQSNLEVSTSPCQNVQEVENELIQRLYRLIEAAREENISFISAGTHPFSNWKSQAVTEDPRYRVQLERIRWSGYRLSTFGVHIHIGVESGEKAIAFMNAMSSYLPHFLALSASSPFWNGFDTGLASVRSKVFESLPGGGTPYRRRNWADFQNMIKVFIKSGTIESVQEIWWDIRPHIKYGTLEIRVCDAMSSMWELMGVVALYQCLVKWMDMLYDRGEFLDLPRHWVIEENKWRAARWGTDCRLITDNKGSQLHIRTVLEQLLEQLEPVAEKLNCLPYLLRIEEILQSKGSATRQRHFYHAHQKNLKKTATFLEEEFLHSISPNGKSLPLSL